MRGDDFIDVMWADALAAIARADRVHRRYFAPATLPVRHVAWTPPVDVYEAADAFIVQAVLPGVLPGQVQCTLDNHVLVIAGERRRPAALGGMTVRRMEIPRGHFECRIDIAAYAITRRELANGCLTLVLAK